VIFLTQNCQITFGENVRILRKSHNLTQRELARIMGIGVQSLRRIERGDFPPGFCAYHLFRMVEYFQIPSDALFYPMDPLL